MKSGRDPVPNRKLTRYQNDPGSNPGADPAGVQARGHARRNAEQLAMADDDDRPDYVRGDDQEDDVVDEDPRCIDCGAQAVYSDPFEVLGHDSLPSKPLCYSCILDRT